MNEVVEKACKICGEGKPLTKFPSVKSGRYRGATCNACRYAKRPPDPKASERTKAWRRDNPERHKSLKRMESKRRTRRLAEAEGRVYRTQAEWDAYWQDYRDRQAAERTANNKQREAERAARIEAKPWLKPDLTEAERWALRYKLDQDFNLRERLRTALRHKRDGVRIGELMRDTIARGGRSRSIERRLGYSIAELITHIERLFTKGMTWPAFLRGDIHIDHRVPLSSFDLSQGDEIRAAWALPNLQPMWASENIAKGAQRMLLV